MITTIFHLRSKDLTMVIDGKKNNAYWWFSIPARIYSVLKTWLWLSMKKDIKCLMMISIPARMLRSKDTPDGCSPRMYQVSIQIRNLPIHNAPQKWSGGHVYDFILSFPVCGTFSPVLLCHRWGGGISYIVISLRYTPVLGSEGAPLSREGQRRRGRQNVS